VYIEQRGAGDMVCWDKGKGDEIETGIGRDGEETRDNAKGHDR
jgi:hypothetical protein